MLWNLTRHHWSCISREVSSPTTPQSPVYHWQPKYQLGELPQSLTAAHWSPQDFKNRGFPAAPLPTSPVITVNVKGWDKLVGQLLNDQLITMGQHQQLRIVRDWLALGVPPYVHHPGTTPTNGKHHIEGTEVHMALDSLASFVQAGHVAGPFDTDQLPWDSSQMKFIGLFGKVS